MSDLVHAHDASTAGPRQRRFGTREVIASIAIAGVFAGIAVPLAIDQAKNRIDAQVKADITAVHTAISEWVLANNVVPTLTTDGTAVLLNGVEVVQVHPGTEVSEIAGLTATTWCITASNPAGKHADPPGYRFKAEAEKPDTGEC